MIDHYAMFKKFIFPNGLELYSFKDPIVSFETVGFAVYAGSRQDPEGKEGLAHFVEHLVADNCSLGDDEITSFFCQQGGNCNLGRTDDLATYYRFSLLAEEQPLHQAFSIFSNMLISSSLKKQEKERRRVINEIIRSRGSKERHEVFEQSLKIICSWHPYFGKGIGVPGTAETFAAITAVDVQMFYNRYYVPANMAIVAYGALSEEKLVEIISQTDFKFDKLGVRNPAPRERFLPAAPKENIFFGQGTKDGDSKVLNCFSLAALPGIVKPAAVSIFVRSLDTVLKEKLQNGQLGIYCAKASWSNHVDSHEFEVKIDAVPRGKEDEVRRILNDCFLEVSKNEQLFEKVKKWCIASFKFDDVNGQGRVNKAIGDLRLFQRIMTKEEIFGEIQNVDFSGIQEIGRWLTPERRWVSFSKQ